jgi:hypothetical protein
MLQKLGEFIAGAVRTLEIVARTAPHKFGIIAPMTNDIGALELANRIMTRVHKTVFRNASGEMRFTVSIGLASPRVQILKDFAQLVEIAERGLGRAIKSGGDRIVHQDTALRPAAASKKKPTDVAAPARDSDQAAVTPLPDSGQAAMTPLPDSGQAPSLETALWLLNNGQAEKLVEHYKPILVSLLPLLEHADQSWSLDLADKLSALRVRLELDHQATDPG